MPRDEPKRVVTVVSSHASVDSKGSTTITHARVTGFFFLVETLSGIVLSFPESADATGSDYSILHNFDGRGLGGWGLRLR